MTACQVVSQDRIGELFRHIFREFSHRKAGGLTAFSRDLNNGIFQGTGL